MKLSREQLTHLFNLYLQRYLIPKSCEHLPLFETLNGGVALTNRLYKVLRAKDLRHLVTGDDIHALDVYELAKDYLELKKKVFIVGLNYWFTLEDLKALRKLYETEISQ